MSVSVVDKGNLNQDQEDVLERFIEFQYAMIEKDLEKLNELLEDNYTLTHMSGKTQTKDEYIGEIMDGTLNYYKSIIHNPIITIKEKDKAILKADVTLDAKVYGIKGTWTLHSEQTMEKIDGNWFLSKWDN
ncbi:MAG: nuclear transport factor 2 family protein [Methanobrevibacter sp.]|uniref:nuclear transport factor 2 family protein n=1 Tax=Methanobrevibacter sp. TaxID=66852 RepID=UPI001B21A4B4|nr:nuclear transport factor 2 family protein [Methanobrevibacter sp.]MBO7210323.1 nuclear transport factor 2 family protein [Methanobrevibacter sp.]MBO7241077.1 nuclear transport factor 2 family protein [Methanobrevibacter sp.]MBO7443416.1 nuclear transport factor 2 family protein [Methanobrevibacter sp.]MBO7517620.1 nuclear transport factor 2 family protein [Methanobrevibacter sp.]